MSEVREQIIEALKAVRPDVDFEKETAKTGEGLLDSFEVIQFVSEIGERMKLDIPVEEIVPENFNSLEAMENLIQSLLEI